MLMHNRPTSPRQIAILFIFYHRFLIPRYPDLHVETMAKLHAGILERRSPAHRRASHFDQREDQLRTNFRYFTRCGTMSPTRFLWFSSYSLKPPSNQYTWLSPSNARMCVHTRSRNQRSWLMITAQPL